MTISDFHAWHTLVLMVVFIGIVWWAYSKKRKSSFNEAANLPFADEDQDKATLQKENNHE